MESSPTRRPSRAKIVAAFGAIYVLWGATFLAIRIAIQTIPPFWMAGTRFLLAGSILYAVMKKRGAPPPNGRHWLSAAIVGALMLVGGNGSVVWAEQRVSSGLAATLLATIPLWMVLLDSLRRGGRKLTVRVASGLGIGLAGVGILAGPAQLWGSSRVDLLGAGVLIFSAFCWASGSLYSRSADLPPSPFMAAAMEMLVGGAMLIVLGILVEGGHLSWRTVSAPSVAGLVYLVAFGSLVGFTAYIWLLGVVSVSRVATYAYVNPVVAVILGCAIADEPISARGLLATGTIVAAVALILSPAPEQEGGKRDSEYRRDGPGPQVRDTGVAT